MVDHVVVHPHPRLTAPAAQAIPRPTRQQRPRSCIRPLQLTKSGHPCRLPIAHRSFSDHASCRLRPVIFLPDYRCGPTFCGEHGADELPLTARRPLRRCGSEDINNYHECPGVDPQRTSRVRFQHGLPSLARPFSLMPDSPPVSQRLHPLAPAKSETICPREPVV